MATGLEMYRAVKKATERLNGAGILKINASDKRDLCQLNEPELEFLGFDKGSAERIANELSHGNLTELGKTLGINLEVDKHALVLIPGEGLRRAAEALKDDPQTLEEMLAEMRHIRHPWRYAR
jgi:hypothetical protein